MVTEVVRPDSSEALAEWMRSLDTGVRVQVRGAGTNDFEDQGSKVVVETLALTNLEHRVEDFSVSVGAGLAWDDLQQELALVGQRVPVDPPAPGTVGAMVATAARGGLIQSAGPMRDQLIGMTVVLGDGTLAHSGGRVIKNVAGYDLAKLFVGSRGSFGVITEVVFRTRPNPPFQRTVKIPVELDELHDLLVLGAGIEMGACDFSEGYLSCLFEGEAQVVERRSERFVALLADRRFEVLDDDASRAHWRHLGSLQVPTPGGLVFACSGRPLALIHALQWLPEALLGVFVTLVAHVGAGVAEVSLGSGASHEMLRELVGRLETSGMALEVRARHRTCDLDFEPARPEALLLDRVQGALDPSGRFR